MKVSLYLALAAIAVAASTFDTPVAIAEQDPGASGAIASATAVDREGSTLTAPVSPHDAAHSGASSSNAGEPAVQPRVP